MEERNASAKLWFSGLVVGTLILVTVGLSGPAWQKLPQEVEQKQDTLIILLDLSLSMFANDVKPSRVERARQKIADILRARNEGVTALVAYAGDGHAVVPLTDDTNPQITKHRTSNFTQLRAHPHSKLLLNKLNPKVLVHFNP